MGRPTVINNVETFCCVPHIILDGAAAFAAVGTKQSKGPKLFSVSGDVAKPGVYEFPLGTPLKTILAKAGAKSPKAVLVGGSGGVCVGKKGFPRALAFEDLPPGGSIIVFGAKRDMLKVLKNIVEFFLEESCGQCVPCREGNYRMYRFVQNLLEGDRTVGKKELSLYLDLADTMKQASKCGLGQSMPNSFLSIMDAFQKECYTVTK